MAVQSIRDAVTGVVLATYDDTKPIDLANAKLVRADLRNHKLGNANFRGADLQHAWLNDGAFEDANFELANLRGAGLSRASMTGTNLRGADLMGANLLKANLAYADLHDAVMLGAATKDTNFGEARGVIDLGHRRDGYRFLLVSNVSTGPMVLAGCRWFTMPEALSWWRVKRPERQLSSESLSRVAAGLRIAKQLHWPKVELTLWKDL